MRKYCMVRNIVDQALHLAMVAKFQQAHRVRVNLEARQRTCIRRIRPSLHNQRWLVACCNSSCSVGLGNCDVEGRLIWQLQSGWVRRRDSAVSGMWKDSSCESVGHMAGRTLSWIIMSAWYIRGSNRNRPRGQGSSGGR